MKGAWEKRNGGEWGRLWVNKAGGEVLKVGQGKVG
jgi:hypothetical protein